MTKPPFAVFVAFMLELERGDDRTSLIEHYATTQCHSH